MLKLVLADCDLELVPELLFGHPSVQSYAKKRGKKAKRTLLDDNYHHSAIRQRFPSMDSELRRGRPDIVHFNLVYVLDSIPHKEEKIRIYIHTRNNQVIIPNPELRIPKSYPRFVGLMEKLLDEGIIKDKDTTLLELHRGVSLQELLRDLGGRVVKFTPKGEKKKVSNVVIGKTIAVVGGFSKGDFISQFDADQEVSVHEEELTSWAVIGEILCALRS